MKQINHLKMSKINELKVLIENGGIVFHCETREIAREFLKIAHDLGYEWCNGDSYDETDKWDEHKSETCYNISNGRYAKIIFYNSIGKSVVNIKDFLELNKPTLLKRHI